MTKAGRILFTIAGLLTVVGCQSQGQVLADPSQQGIELLPGASANAPMQ